MLILASSIYLLLINHVRTSNSIGYVRSFKNTITSSNPISLNYSSYCALPPLIALELKFENSQG